MLCLGLENGGGKWKGGKMRKEKGREKGKKGRKKGEQKQGRRKGKAIDDIANDNLLHTLDHPSVILPAHFSTLADIRKPTILISKQPSPKNITTRL